MSNSTLDQDDLKELQILEAHDTNAREGPLHALLVKRSDLDLTGKVHEISVVQRSLGGYSDVFTGYYTSADGRETKVAVKKLRVHIMDDRKFQRVSSL